MLEVQLDLDPNKEWTIVVYRGGLRRDHKCPAWAVLFSPEPSVRADMQDRMFFYEPELRPYVITPEMIPIVHDLQVALDNYAWAVLAAAIHNTGPHAVVGATVAIERSCVSPRRITKDTFSWSRPASEKKSCDRYVSSCHRKSRSS